MARAHTHLVGKDELAERLAISPRTIEKWVGQRRIPFVRIGGRCVRFDLAEIDSWLADRSVPVGGVGRRAQSAPTTGTAA